MESFTSSISHMTSNSGFTQPKKAEGDVAGDPLASKNVAEELDEFGIVDGMAAKLHMQDLMNHHAQQALMQQSKLAKRRISQFAAALREITGTAFFDFMIALLVLADTATLVLQEEWKSEDGTMDDAELLLRGASAAIITTFGVEFLARSIGQIGHGFSWILVMDGIIVAGSCIEVFWSALAPNTSPALVWLRPLRGLRLFRAIRSCIKLLRRSAVADLALVSLGRSAKPMFFSLALVFLGFLASSVIMTLQVPGVLDELESDEIKQEVLDKFGTVFDATATLLAAIAGSNDLGLFCMKIFTQSGHQRLQIALFLATVLAFVLLMGLCLGGVICGVLAAQLIILKGDAEVDGGNVNFRKNQLIVGSLDKAFRAAGHSSADNIDWNDILTALAVPLDKAAASSAAQSEKVEKELQGLLVARPEGASEARSQKDDGAKDLSLDAWQERMDSPISEATLDDGEMVELLKYRCTLQEVHMEDLRAAYHEMALFGPVCVEDFILCVFKHSSRVKTLPALSFNHQQNKVYSRILLHGLFVDDGLRDMQRRLGELQAQLPPMITEAEAASNDLAELEALEDRLERKKKALRALIAEREKDQKAARIPKEELIQAQQDGAELDALLEDLEKQVAELEGQNGLAPDEVTEVINSLADDLVHHVWQLLLQELQQAEQAVVNRI